MAHASVGQDTSPLSQQLHSYRIRDILIRRFGAVIFESLLMAVTTHGMHG